MSELFEAYSMDCQVRKGSKELPQKKSTLRWSRAFRPSTKFRRNKVIKMKFVNLSIEDCREPGKSDAVDNYRNSDCGMTDCDKNSRNNKSNRRIHGVNSPNLAAVLSPLAGNVIPDPEETFTDIQKRISHNDNDCERNCQEHSYETSNSPHLVLSPGSVPLKHCLEEKLKCIISERDDAVAAAAALAMKLSEADTKIKRLEDDVARCRIDAKSGLSRISDLQCTLNENKLSIQQLKHDLEISQLGKHAAELELRNKNQELLALKKQYETTNSKDQKLCDSCNYEPLLGRDEKQMTTLISSTVAPEHRHDACSVVPSTPYNMKVTLVETPENIAAAASSTRVHISAGSGEATQQGCSVMVSPSRALNLFATICPTTNHASVPDALSPAKITHPAKKVIQDAEEMPKQQQKDHQFTDGAVGINKRQNSTMTNTETNVDISNERQRKCQKKEYAAELEEQIRLAKQKRQQEHQATYGQREEYFPFGRPGGGAPVRSTTFHRGGVAGGVGFTA